MNWKAAFLLSIGLLFLPLLARAQTELCDAIQPWPAGVNEGDETRSIQKGLQEFYSQQTLGDTLLTDGKFGEDTTKWLKRLCNDVPLGDAATLEDVYALSRHYGGIEQGAEIAMLRAGGGPTDTQEVVNLVTLASVNPSLATSRMQAIEAVEPASRVVFDSDDFLSWLNRDPAQRLPRLLGTENAVLKLLQEYEQEAAQLGEFCKVSGASPLEEYFLLKPEALEPLDPMPVTEALTAISQEYYPSDDRTKLLADLTVALRLNGVEFELETLSNWLEEKDALTRNFRVSSKALENENLVSRFAPAFIDRSRAFTAQPFTSQNRNGAKQALCKMVRVANGQAASELPEAPCADDTPERTDTEDVGSPGGETDDQQSANTTENQNSGPGSAEAEPTPPPQEADISEASKIYLGPEEISALEDLIVQTVSLKPEAIDGLVKEFAISLGNRSIVGLEERYFFNDRLLGEALRFADSSLDPTTGGKVCELARQTVSLSETQANITGRTDPWKKPGCGCGVPRKGESLVYGFHDPRLPISNGSINFELIDRIGYIGGTIGSDAAVTYFGDIPNPAGTVRNALSDLVHASHKHRSKVDFTYLISGLEDWTDQEISIVAEKIAQHLKRPHKEHTLVRSTLRALRMESSPYLDGVTLMIEGYDDNNVTNLKALLINLRRQINATPVNASATVNLAFDVDLGQSADLFDPILEELEDLQGQPNPETPYIDKIFIFLEQPTSVSRSTLNMRLDMGFAGEDRTGALPSIVPIIAPLSNNLLGGDEGGKKDAGDQGSEPSEDAAAEGEGSVAPTADMQAAMQQEFSNIIAEFKFDFGGVAFWPLPYSGNEKQSYSTMTSIIANQYDQDGLTSAVPIEVCNFVCPNRTSFFLVLSSAIAGQAALIIMALFSRSIAATSAKFHLQRWLTLATFGLVFIIAVCDPLSRYWAGGLALIAVFIIGGQFYLQRYDERVSGPTP